MGILDDVMINAKTAAEVVGKKAGQIVDVSKLRFNVAELNAELSKRYEALGEYIYENCRECLAEDAESVGKMAEIDELVNQRNALTKELVDKQNKVVCPVCGKQSPITASFCSNCGAKLDSGRVKLLPTPRKGLLHFATGPFCCAFPPVGGL